VVDLWQKSRSTYPGISILAGDLRERADKSAVAAINRALRFTRKKGGTSLAAYATFYCGLQM
jgi:hypothetical protein